VSAVEYFRELVQAQKCGTARGIASVCSSHPSVLEAAIAQARDDGQPALIESTVNQVNQFGGYTGMRSADFVSLVRALAARVGLPSERVILGADHLGPWPWRAESAEAAMAKACTVAAESAAAGYAKLHLDASMSLAGDPTDAHGALDAGLVAEREARLAEAAERARAGTEMPVYVIGTEVPRPGGTAGGGDVQPTPPPELLRTVEECRAAFAARGLAAAWKRVIAVVVQPGVEFDDQDVHAYRRESARELCAAARGLPGLVLEGHSTDYQSLASLRELVEDGVAILKVGPALTFAMREALFGLEAVERELFEGDPGVERSNLRQTLDRAMRDDPTHWRGYYRGDERALLLARRYSLSDRSRYYWSVPSVEASVARLLANLAQARPPRGLVSQYVPSSAGAFAVESKPWDPRAVVVDAVRDVLRVYSAATNG
jgi:D-tagatose-1,6-bisphosphate aldolase subunit GatZ/KbaZ